MQLKSAKADAPRYGRVVPDIVGQREITPAQAARNRKTGRGPKRPREARAGILAVSPATFWRYVAAGAFKPIKLSPGVTVFDLAEVHGWVQSNAGGRK